MAQANFIIDRDTVFTCNTRCLRCGAPLIPDRDDVASCLMCGWYPGWNPVKIDPKTVNLRSIKMSEHRKENR